MRKQVSYSQYMQYVNCKKQYELTYIEGLSIRQPSIYTLIGTSIHETIQQYYDEQFPIKYNYSDILFSYIEKNIKIQSDKFQETFVNSTELNDFFVQSQVVLQKFVSNRTELISPELQYIKSEYELKCDLSFLGADARFRYINIIGFIDMLFKTIDGKYIIFDIKSSNKGWTIIDKKNKYKLFQLILYKKLLSLISNIDENDIEIKYLFLEYGTGEVNVFTPNLSKINENELFNEFRDFIFDVFDENGMYIQRF